MFPELNESKINRNTLKRVKSEKIQRFDAIAMSYFLFNLTCSSAEEARELVDAASRYADVVKIDTSREEFVDNFDEVSFNVYVKDKREAIRIVDEIISQVQQEG